MSKQKLSKIKIFLIIALIILISLLVSIVVLSIPIGLSYLFGLLLSSKDGYLLTGFSFCICGIILIILVPIIIFLLASNKKNRISDIKNLFSKFKAFSIIIILIIAFLEIAFASRAYTYYKDIKEGPKDAIMMESIVKRKSGYRSSSTYIKGFIDGKETMLEITRDARSKVSNNKKYKIVKIKYYEHIKEIYDIDVYVSYKDDK